MKAELSNAVIAIALFASCAGSSAQDNGTKVNPEQARANFARPIVLAPDDVRAFPSPPAGFADAQPGVAQGRVEELNYDSGVTGTRRKANVYLPAGYDGDVFEVGSVG